MNRIARFCCFFFLLSSSLIAQEAVVLIVDQQTEKPIEFAHIVAQINGKPELFVTDVTGKATIQSAAAIPVAVTFIGYQTQKDTLVPGSTKTIRLQRGDFELNDVVVTAQYLPTRPEESIVNVRIIDNEKIESKGAVNLSQLLNDELNIRLQTDGIIGTGLSMQGLSGQNVKILIDGVPVIGRLDGTIDLNQINLQDIERVEIVEGPVSVNYGSNALAGAINLITKKSKGDQFKAGGQLFYESVGAYNADAWFQVPLKGQQALRVSGGRNFFDGWSPDEESSRDLQWNQKEQLFGRVAYNTTLSDWNLNYELRAFDELIKDKGERRSAYSNYAFDNWYTTYRVDNQIGLNRKFKNDWKLDVIAGYNWFRRDNVQYNRDLVNLTEEINPDPTPHDTTLNSLFISRGTMSTIREEAALNYQLGYEVNYETGGGKRIESGYQSMGDYALFGSVQWQVNKKFKVQPGLRVSYNTDYTSQPVPSVHAAWNPSKDWQLRASYARGFRAPSIKELYIEFIDANHNIVGNTGLQAEYSHHADISLEHSLSDKKAIHNVRIKPTLFFNHLSNQIELAQVNGTQFSYVNINETTTGGAQLEVTYSIHPDFTFTAGGTWLYQSFTVDSEAKDYSSPEAQFGFKYWRPSKKFGFDVNYKFTGQSPQVTLPEEGIEIATVDAFHWLDISATQKFWKNRIALTVGGRNLLGVQNLGSTAAASVHGGGGSVPMAWGRTLFTSLKFTF